MERKYFNQAEYLEEFSNYSSAAQTLTRVCKEYKKLDNAEFTPEVMALIQRQAFDELEKRYIKEQLKSAGKNPIMVRGVMVQASEDFNLFKKSLNTSTRGFFSLYSVDLTLFKIEGEEVIFVGDEVLRLKHTHKPETDNQKRYMQLVEQLEALQAQIKELAKDLPIIDGCFFNIEGSLEFNEVSVQYIN